MLAPPQDPNPGMTKRHREIALLHPPRRAHTPSKQSNPPNLALERSAPAPSKSSISTVWLPGMDAWKTSVASRASAAAVCVIHHLGSRHHRKRRPRTKLGAFDFIEKDRSRLRNASRPRPNAIEQRRSQEEKPNSLHTESASLPHRRRQRPHESPAQQIAVPAPPTADPDYGENAPEKKLRRARSRRQSPTQQAFFVEVKVRRHPGRNSIESEILGT